MHIKLLYRKVLYVFLSLMIVISSTQSAFAASAGGWTITETIMNAGTATITAVKGSGSTALRSVVNYAPTAAVVAREIVAVGSIVGLSYAASQLLGSGVDWVLDPANNRVKYKVSSATDGGEWYNSNYSTPDAFCAWYSNITNNRYGALTSSIRVINSTSAVYTCKDAGGAVVNESGATRAAPTEDVYDYMPISAFANKIVANAVDGHAESKAGLKSVAIADFNAGLLDNSLEAAAVPADSTTPIDPANPTDPTAPFDASSIVNALKSVVSAITNMSSALTTKLNTMLVELGLMNAETNKVINESVDRVIENDNVKVGEIVAAIEAIEGNMLTGEVINDAVDRVIAEGKTNTSDIVAAIEAIEGNTLDGQVINDAVDKVITNDNINAQATQDVVSQSIDEAIEASHVDTASVTDAIDAQTDAISQADPVTGETSLKLPTFCGWAGTVCDYMDWVKGEYQTMSDFVKAEPETMPDEPVVVADDPSGLGDVFRDKAEAGYVSFSRECPANVLIPVSLMGVSQSLNISYAPFCHFASLIRPAVILGAWISGLLIISGGRARE